MRLGCATQASTNLTVLIVPPQNTSTWGKTELPSESPYSRSEDHLDQDVRRWAESLRARYLPRSQLADVVSALLSEQRPPEFEPLVVDDDRAMRALAYSDVAKRLNEMVGGARPAGDFTQGSTSSWGSQIRRAPKGYGTLVGNRHHYDKHGHSLIAGSVFAFLGQFVGANPDHYDAKESSNKAVWLHIKEILDSATDFEDGWDGYAAAPASDASVFFAKLVIDRLAGRFVAPKLFIDSEGDIVFTWQTARRRLFLTVEAFKLNFLIKYAYGKKLRFDDVKFEGTRLPAKLTRYLPKRVKRF